MKKFVFTIIMICLLFVIIVGASEIILRKLHHLQPLKQRAQIVNEPKILVEEPIVGWTIKKGDYFIPRYSPEGDDIQMTYLSDGIRNTGITAVDAEINSEVLVVGCSYTQGWAISDNETFAWKLQEKYPNTRVINYGIGAYGTYQSLLVLERELPKMAAPRIALYGFYEYHDERNVASFSWLETLEKHSRRVVVNVPFATLDKAGMLVRNPPEHYPRTPFREYSSAITFIESLYVRLKSFKRDSQKQQVTKKLITEMNNVSERFGAKFIVVILFSRNLKEDYIRYFEDNNINYIDCTHELSNDMKVPGEGHPNGKLNSLWAECISKHIDPYIE